MTPNLCENCKHFTPATDTWSSKMYQAHYAVCARTALVTPSLGATCASERSAFFFRGDRCGKHARYFELKETP